MATVATTRLAEYGIELDLKDIYNDFLSPEEQAELSIPQNASITQSFERTTAFTKEDEAWLDTNGTVNRYINDPIGKTVTSQAFNIRATLDIQTDRPDITDTFSYDFTKTTNGNPWGAITANDAKTYSLKYEGHPLDIMLDRHYKQMQRDLDNIAMWENAVQSTQKSIDRAQQNLKNNSRPESITPNMQVLRESEQFISNYVQPELEKAKAQLSSTLAAMKAELGDTHNALGYARDVFYQRSGLGDNKPLDITQMMAENGVLSANEASSYPSLSLNTASAKNQAYATTVIAKKEEIAAQVAAKEAQEAAASAAESAAERAREEASATTSAAAQASYSSYNLPDGTLLFMGNELSGIDLRGKMLAVSIPNYGPDSQIFLEDILKNVRQDAHCHRHGGNQPVDEQSHAQHREHYQPQREF